MSPADGSLPTPALLHNREPVAAPPAPKDDPPISGSTGQDCPASCPGPGSGSLRRPLAAVSAERQAARAVASRVIATSAAATCGGANVARALGVSAQYVAQLANPEHGAAMTLGDLLAVANEGETAFASTVLVALLALVQQRTREPLSSRATLVEQALGLSAAVGCLSHDVREAIEDGTIDARERVILARDAEAIVRGAEMLRAAAISGTDHTLVGRR